MVAAAGVTASVQMLFDVLTPRPIGLIAVACVTVTGMALLGATSLTWLLVGLFASLAVIGSP